MPIQKTKKIWMDGAFVNWDDANIHILTHGLHYGSAVFEGIRAYNTIKATAVFRLKEHIVRLFNSAKLYFMDIPYSVDEICMAVKKTVKINDVESCYIRPIVYRGYGEMGLNPLNASVNVAIAVWPWGTYLGEDGIKNGIRAKISSFRRIDPNILPPSAKATGQYINSILAKIEAIKTGFDEAILLDSRGFVAEGPGENLFVVRDGQIYTPPVHASILYGITRSSVITIAENMGFNVRETDLTRDFLYTSDELFFTGTAAEITPVREVDGYKIGRGKPGEITKDIQKKFFDIIAGKDKKYAKWLDSV